MLVLGWGSTYGPIAAGVPGRPQRRASASPRAHLRHLNPFPANIGDVLRRYRRVLVPEMNLGQLSLLLRARYLVDVAGHTRVRGLPFTSAELVEQIAAAREGDVVTIEPRAARPSAPAWRACPPSATARR